MKSLLIRRRDAARPGLPRPRPASCWSRPGCSRTRTRRRAGAPPERGGGHRDAGPVGRAVGRPSPSPSGVGRSPSGSVAPTADAGGHAAGLDRPEPTPKPGRAVATRVVVPALKIDLPVVKGNDGYPYCNVAMYLHTANAASKDAFGQPGEGRATYLYAHARDGMFGPIYELAIQKKNAKKMLGMVVQVYTSDFKLHLYEIREYRLHVTDLDGPLPGDQRGALAPDLRGAQGHARQDAAPRRSRSPSRTRTQRTPRPRPSP